jgi:hypothetical protein
LAPWREVGQAVALRSGQGQPVFDALNAELAAPVRFVPQDALPAGVAYEQHIFEARCCPTREGLHDFFNGLCWHRFPQTKRRLNQLHMDQITQGGIRPVRGAVRDAITVFDENAALLQAPQALWDALVAKDWSTLMVSSRPLWAQARLDLFGHALLEKLVSPRKAITAHVLRVPESVPPSEMDGWLAQALTPELLASKPFAHLPVLGVPGWCSENEAPAFYADVSVFRLPRAPTLHPMINRTNHEDASV